MIQTNRIRTCWIVPDVGYYHHARMEAFAAKGFESHFVEVVDQSEYPEFRKPDRGVTGRLYERHTLYEGKEYRNVAGRLATHLGRVLDGLKPDAICVNGWGDAGALLSVLWATEARCPVVMMSDSAEHDERRLWWREAAKSRVVRLCGAALVAGTLHRDYVRSLGLSESSIFDGYDAIDNSHFAAIASDVRAKASEWQVKMSLPRRYFLAVGRLVPKKNFIRLLEAYSVYRRWAREEGWQLVVVGGGIQDKEIRGVVERLGLVRDVLMLGFKRYNELPVYYGLAGAFVHPSTTEQWGLVVNEAMASGLPVIVSERCGCAPDLVRNGVNGFTFDPYNVEELARLMLTVASDHCDREAMGRSSQEMIAEWGPERFADGLMKAVEMAISRPPVKASWFDRALLWALAHR